MKLYRVLDTIEEMIVDLCSQDKLEVISKYKNLKFELEKIDFYLELDNMTEISLVSKNLTSLTVEKVSDTINKINDFKRLISVFY